MLAVEASLVAESPGLRIRIDGQGRTLTCRLDGEGANLLITLRRSRHLLPVLRALIPVLLRSGLSLEVTSGNLRIGRAGSGVKQNALGRLLRLPSAHIGR